MSALVHMTAEGCGAADLDGAHGAQLLARKPVSSPVGGAMLAETRFLPDGTCAFGGRSGSTIDTSTCRHWTALLGTLKSWLVSRAFVVCA